MKEQVENNIVKLRADKGIRQEDLAKFVGTTRQTIIALEKGNYKPSVFLALKIAEFFGKNVNEIFYINRQ